MNRRHVQSILVLVILGLASILSATVGTVILPVEVTTWGRIKSLYR